jgi:HD-GYP domain-containing protein (c-di-GMP phosphodiesterase class II)
MRQRLFRQCEVVAALSHALDLAEGQPPGHALRSCLIGMRLGQWLRLGPSDRSALLYALLLKDVGGSSNASRVAALFDADDLTVKRDLRLIDWSRPSNLALYSIRKAAPGQNLLARTRRLASMATGLGEMARDIIRIRCERGAEIVRSLGFPEETALAVRHLDEHWDGSGGPDGKGGGNIPLLARIACLSQAVEAHMSHRGLEAAFQMALERRESWFDPELVDLLLELRRDRAWWEELRGPKAQALLLQEEPVDQVRLLDDDGLDRLAEAFAEIIDAKTPFTLRHSMGVAGYARGIAAVMGLSAEEQRRLYRAGLLHDIGKLSLSNRILEKRGPLTPEERRKVELYPLHTWEILSRIPAFQDVAWMAALHHERLDGTGYPWKMGAPQLDLPARILAVADVFEALTAPRPHRPGMAPEAALSILAAEAQERLDPDVVRALEAYLKSGKKPSEPPEAIP